MLELTTPSILFSATSLILLAYTNRFLSYAVVIRNLKNENDTHHDSKKDEQIKNLYKRLYLTQAMQIIGILSMLLSVISMVLIYFKIGFWAEIFFGAGLLFLTVSLCIMIWEINISVKALEIHLSNAESTKPFE